MRVLLVEDSEFIRQQFLRLFDELKFVTVVGYADREDDAVAAIAALKPDVVLVDLNLQGGSGMHVLSRARGEGYAASCSCSAAATRTSIARCASATALTASTTRPMNRGN